jgi:hypothetical protein
MLNDDWWTLSRQWASAVPAFFIQRSAFGIYRILEAQ